MTLVNEDMSKILDYLSRNDQDYDGVYSKVEKMENFQPDRLLVRICIFTRTLTNVTLVD